ncbi:zinc ABC transporter substrate-binding protein [bacterium]|nr:zinc ABC transporter substrate-binding protein [bacterium]
MKKILLIVTTILLLTGCNLKKDNLENSTIYTTIYPIKYLTEFLYKDYANIESIYPAGADVTNYSLTEKQINKYAKADLFIYNGLSNEKNITKNLINKNRNLLIIDVSNGLSYTYGVKELWMSPNNYLMLAKNIKDYLKEYLQSSIITENVDHKYNELAEMLSTKDADLREIGKKAMENGTNTLVVSDNVFRFLENYGFNIISLDEETLTESSLNSIKSSFMKKKYKNILVLDNNYTDNIKNIINDSKAKAIDVKSMMNTDANNNTEDYLTVMQDLIDNIRNLCIVD